MRTLFLACALLVLAGPATAQKIEVAEGDWSNVPATRFVGLETMSPEVLLKVQQLVADGECTLAGVSKRRIDMTVPFLVHFSPTGAVEHVVLRRLNCEKAEGVLAGALLAMLNSGAAKPRAKNLSGWYRSELSFASS